MGYSFTRRRLRDAVAPLVEAGSVDPHDPDWLAAWRWYLTNAHLMYDLPWRIGPEEFAKRARYWMQMSQPPQDLW